METINLSKEKYTLNSNFILRVSNRDYSLYDINTDMKYKISKTLYFTLKLFERNATNLSRINNYFESENINIDFNRIKKLIQTRVEFKQLLVPSKAPFRTGNTYEKHCYRKDQRYEFTPESIDFLITNKCNLCCPHCYRNSLATDKLEGINLKRLHTLFDEMEELKIRSLKVTGGEPFLVPELFDIISYASRKRIHISILTNATIPLGHDWLKLLASDNISLGVSLDGTTASTHETIRGNGTFLRTMTNLYTFSKAGINYSVTFTINSKNAHQIITVLDLVANKLNNRKITFNFVEKIGRATSDLNNLAVDRNEIFKIKNRLLALKKTNPNLSIKIVDNAALESDIEEIEEIKDKGEFIICKAGMSILAIDAQLNVYPCIYGIGGKTEYPVANLNNDTLINIWNNSRKLDVFRCGLTIDELPKCRECDYRDICNLKYCRLRPLYEGNRFTDPVSFCYKNQIHE